MRFEFTPGQVAALLVPSWQSFRNRRQKAGKSDVLRAFLFAFVGLVFSLFVFGGFYRMLLYIGQFAEFTAPLTHQVLGTTSTFILTMLFASTVVTALSTQYLSEDLSLLVSSPISLPALYGSRLVLTALQSSWMVVLFSIPIYAAFALTSPAPWHFLGAAALTLAPLVVIAATVGSMVTSVLMAVFPARRVRELLVLLAALFVVLLVFLIRVQQPEKLLNPRSIYDISEFFAAFQTPSSSLLPSSWATTLRKASPVQCSSPRQRPSRTVSASKPVAPGRASTRRFCQVEPGMRQASRSCANVSTVRSSGRSRRAGPASASRSRASRMSFGVVMRRA